MPARTNTKLKRALNRKLSAMRLREAGVAFEERNFGAHYIVAGAWLLYPGTGEFRELRGGRCGRGVFRLIEAIKDNA